MNRALQKTIFVACKELGLDNEARRDLQLQVCGKSSMSDMTDAEMTSVIARLKDDGFAPSGSGQFKHPIAPRADLRTIHVLWRVLRDAGELDRPSRAGLNAFVRARFGDAWASVPADIDMLRDADQIEAVIMALKSWIKRKSIPFDWNRIK